MTGTEEAKFKPHIRLLAGIWVLLTLAQAILNFGGTDKLLEYRAWEAVRVPGSREPFFHLASWQGQASGDLSHMASIPQLTRTRAQVFNTDEYGFRNPVGSLKEPVDVLICGDSFAAGSQLSEGETLADLIRGEADLKIYNYGGSDPTLLLGDTRFAKQMPRLVILLMTERVVGPPPKYERPDTILHWTPATAEPGPHTPRKYRRTRFLERYESARYFRLLTEPVYNSFTWELGLRSLPASIGHIHRESGMIFYRKSIANALDPQHHRAEMLEVVGFLEWYAASIAERGGRLMVVPAPSKEVIYSHRVPALSGGDAGGFHKSFVTELEKNGVNCINTLDKFREFMVQNPDDEVYFAGDTHLSPAGNRVIFQALVPTLLQLKETPSGAE